MFKLFRTFLIVLLLSTPLKAICQIDVPKWVDDIGGPSSSCISSGIEVDNQNNIYVSGIFSGTADMDPSGAVYNLTAKGEFDLFLAKYTTNGALIWAIDAGGSAYVQVNAMAIDQNGNCIVTGQFNSSFDADPGPGNTTLTPAGDYDAFIIKYNTNGKFVWARSIGGSGTDYGSHVATDSQGNIFECVRFQSTVTVGGKTVTAGGGDFNGLTVKYDPNGNVLWKINIYDPGNSEVFDEVDPQGNVIVGGHFQSNDDFNPLGAAHMLNANGDAQFIAKYTTAGQLIWVQKFGGVLAGNNLNLGIDNEGNVIADGPFSSQLTFNGGTTVLNPTGSQDLFLAKYTTDGVFQSAKDIGGAGSSIFNYTIHASHDDNIFITGYFSGKIDFDPSPATTSLISDHGQRDFFLAKYDNDLNYKWAFSGGSPNCDQSLGRNTCIDNNNDVLFTGAFCSTVNFSASTCTPYVLTAQSVGASPARDCFVGKYVQSEATAASQITAFSVPQEIAPAVIDQTKLSITVTVPPGTNITALVPTITYTTGVTLTPASGKAEDFTSGVTYKLTTSCTSLNYSVNVVFAISSPVTICSGTTASLTGDTETPVPDSYLWQVSQNGTWVSAAGTINGQNYQTPVLNNATASNVIYSYRRQTTTAGVIAYDSYFDVTVLPAIAGNTITAPTVISFCSNGDPSTISGSTPTGGNGTYTYQWQSSADGISFNNIAGAASKDYDPPVLTTTTYYQRIVNSCGPQVISNVVKITIVPPPVPPAPFSQSICPGATATLTIADALPGLTYNWYDSAAKTNLLFTGTIYTTGPLTVNTTYYVEAANGTCVSTTTAIVQVNVITPPAAPTVISPVVACDGATVSLSVSNPQPGLTYNWYTVPTGGTSVATGSTYAVTASASNTTYYVEAVNTNSCTGPRSEIDITVVPIPAAPVVTAAAICSGSATVLTISNPQAGLTYNWYATATDQTPLASGTQFNTPTFLNNTTYYVEAVSNTGGCTSTRVAVLVTITPLAVAPGNLTQSVCAGSPVTLTLSDAQTGITYNWYDSPAKTNLLFTGTTYTVNAVNSNTTYYVEAVNGSCTATSLATVQVNIIALPSAPAVVKSVLQTCANTQVTLSITNPQPGFTYNWYTAPSGGTAAGTGTDFLTPVLTSGATYYAEAVNANGCVSSRTPVNVNVSPLPDVSTQGASVCPGTNATLTASSTDANATINWYAGATGGLPIGTGNSFTTPNLNDITTYYAQAVDGVSGCASATRSAATVNIYQQLAAPVVTVDGTTSSSVTFKWGAVTGASGYLVSIDNGVTYTAPSSGSNGLSTTITGLQQDQTVTILVEATGVSTCQLSGSSTAVTGVAHDSKNDVIYVANTFTPNGDGKNDVVYVHSNNIKSMTFYVYDQWGEMLFKSTDINVGWDGTYKGTMQPVGVYVYFVQAVMVDGTQLTKKGTITLIR